MILNANALHIPLADGTVHLVVTSPPYWNAESYSFWPTYQEYLDDMEIVYRECFRVMCDGARIAVNVPHGYDRPGNGGYKPIGDHTTAILQKIGFELRGHVIWDKMGLSPQDNGTAWGSWMSASNPSLRDGHEIIIVAHKGSPARKKGVDTISKDDFIWSTKSIWHIPPISNSWHPAPFPAEIPRRLIELYSFKNDIVLDPFSGSGTTAKTANQLGRIGIGLELSMKYARRSMVDFALVNKEWDLARRLIAKKQKPAGDLPLFAPQSPTG